MTTQEPAAMTDPILTLPEFLVLIKTHRIRGEATVNALRLVRVSGMTPAEAARAAQLDAGALSRALVKLSRPLCPCCKQLLQAP